MDPNAALASIRDLTDEILRAIDVDQDGPAATHDLGTLAEDLATNVRSLDSWLSQGGFLPSAWKREE